MCFYCTAFGQWVVSDPALTQLSQITWAKELKQAYEQFQVLGESRDILTKSLDLYRQVNGVIKNSKMVLQVLSMQGEMLELAAKECTRSDVFTGQEAYGEYTNVLNKIMEESVLSFDLIRTIISPSVSMTDGERIKIIVDLDNKLKENRDKMLDERARFNTHAYLKNLFVCYMTIPAFLIANALGSIIAENIMHMCGQNKYTMLGLLFAFVFKLFLFAKSVKFCRELF